MPIRRLFAALSLLVALTVSGCIRDVASVAGPGTKAAGGTGTDLAGTYILRTGNGQSLPYTYRTEGADTYVLLDDAVTMTAAGQWNEVWHERHTVGGVVSSKSLADAGTFTLTGTRIVVTIVSGSSGTGTYEGTYSNGTLTLPGQSSSGGPVETMIYTK
ncbi:MAG TPA: hypothetical protein VFI52_12010 [Gemmatimonadaceae bacterium]|nr:hypothetical protein [Gemmatimonadaceae bacterium]